MLHHAAALTFSSWLSADLMDFLAYTLLGLPRLEYLRLSLIRDLRGAGVALGSLLAANAPALRELHLEDCDLGGIMWPLLHGLSYNTRLQSFTAWDGEGWHPFAGSDDFLRSELIPIMRNATSLRTLKLLPPAELLTDVVGACAEYDEDLERIVSIDLLMQLQEEVRARGHDPNAARNWRVAYTRWTKRAAARGWQPPVPPERAPRRQRVALTPTPPRPKLLRQLSWKVAYGRWQELAPATKFAAALRRADAAMAQLLADEEQEQAERARSAASKRKKKRGGKGGLHNTALAPADVDVSAAATAEGGAAAASAHRPVELSQSSAQPSDVQPAPASRTTLRAYAPPPMD